MARNIIAYVISAAITVFLAAGFYTQQVLARQADIGVEYSTSQSVSTFIQNLGGLAPTYGLILFIALAIGFLAATFLKRILTPLAKVAYPVAGGAAVFTALWLIENVVAGGGVGVMGGARGTIGLAMQVFSGVCGGFVYSLLRSPS
ncbi:MAG: hypothetical protein HKP25_00350 [Marinicaulis sp.]|nr:hypothetical protein [Marinicaulis sp.]